MQDLLLDLPRIRQPSYIVNIPQMMIPRLCIGITHYYEVFLRPSVSLGLVYIYRHFRVAPLMSKYMSVFS